MTPQTLTSKPPSAASGPRDTEFARLRASANLSVSEFADRMGCSPRTVHRWDRGDSQPHQAALQYLRTLIPSTSSRLPAQPYFQFVDLFAGIGGLRLGFESVGGQCIFTSEWNKFALQTYRANHECDHDVVGDITQIEATQIPSHDVLLAGFPCQPFSIAGVSKKNALDMPHGFGCDIQGTLFFDIARILEHHRPRAFLLENVKNLISHDKGRTFEVIHHTLTEELGYSVTWRVINARPWVPQHRERIFIVGFRDATNFTLDDLEVPDAATGPRLRSILHPQDGSEWPDNPYTHGHLATVSSKYTLSDHLWQYLRSYAEKHRAAGNGFGYGLVCGDDIARTLSARYYKDGSEILIKQANRNPRRLTPRECARLMGFDRAEGEPFKIPVSDTQAYRQFGNSVVVPCVEAVAALMAEHLHPRSEPHPPKRLVSSASTAALIA